MISEKQQEYLLNATHRWNFKTGATRSGKSWLDYTYVIPKRIRERADKPGLNVILGVTKSTIERNILEPMRSLYGEKLVGYIRSDNKCKMFGQWVYCLGAEKITQVSHIRGSSIKYCYGDEVADWSKEVFEILKSRLDTDCSCFDGALNPQSPGHWLKKFLESDADIYCQKYTIFDNPFLPEDFVKQLCIEYAGSVFYRRYILGEWAIAEGLVYAMFLRDKHVFSGPVEYKYTSTYYISMDYGILNPFAANLMELTASGKVRSIKESHYSGRETGTIQDDEFLYKKLKELATGYPITGVIIDPSAASMKATIQKYQEFIVYDGNNDVIPGIKEVMKYINFGLLEIHDSCTETLNETESYAWDSKAGEEDKEQVIKKYDHHMDAIRYFIYTIARMYNRGRI